MQIAFDESAAFERLSGIHGVDDLLFTYFITKTITGCTEHTGDGEILRERGRGKYPECNFIYFYLLFH